MTTSSNTPRSSGRRWSWIVGIAAALTAGGIGGWFLWNESSHAALANARKRLGPVPTSLGEVDAWLDDVFGPVPADANGAPVLRLALAPFHELGGLDADFDEDLFTVDDELQRVVREQETNLDGLAEALQAPRFRFAIPWENELDTETTPFSFGFIEASSVIRARIAVRIADGDLEAAVEDVKLLVRLGESLREVPRVLEQMLRAGLVSRASRCLRGVLERVDEPQAVLGTASIAPVTGAIRFALAAEPLLMLDLGQQMLEASELTLFGVLAPRLRSDLALLIDHLAEMRELTKEPSANALARVRSAKAKWLEDAGWLGSLLAIDTGEMFEHELELRAQVLLTEAGAEALAFRMREGRWPRAEELPGGMVDPVGGEPLVVEVDGAALVLELGEASWRVEVQ